MVPVLSPQNICNFPCSNQLVCILPIAILQNQIVSYSADLFIAPRTDIHTAILKNKRRLYLPGQQQQKRDKCSKSKIFIPTKDYSFHRIFNATKYLSIKIDTETKFIWMNRWNKCADHCCAQNNSKGRLLREWKVDKGLISSKEKDWRKQQLHIYKGYIKGYETAGIPTTHEIKAKGWKPT